MFDVKILRENRPLVEQMLERRGSTAPLDRILQMDDKRVSHLRRINELREQRNRITGLVSREKDPGEREKLIASNREVRDKILEEERALSDVQQQLGELLMWVPNLLSPDVPQGKDDSENVEVRRWGTPRDFDFPIKDHLDVGEGLGLIDTAKGAKVWGTRTYFLMNDAVYLELALVRFGFDLLVSEGFMPVIPPIVVREDVLLGTRHLPFFSDQIYRIEGQGLGLVGTSEIPLGAMHGGEVLREQDLPLKYVGFSPCYRTEVGSGGRDVRGLIRTHHFDKLEMFVFDLPENSEETHEWMVSLEERIFQALEIPYRVVNICSGDLGPVAYKKYDLEFWKPSDNVYREITSCSNCTDFQSRGLNIRYKKASGGKTAYVHTLNGTAIAIGRTIAAILENYQNEDGSVTVPDVLRPFMPGEKRRLTKSKI